MSGLTFHFLQPPSLIDGELELIPPRPADLDAFLQSANHPLSLSDGSSHLSRHHLARFLDSCPLGHQYADPIERLPPTYHFWLRLNQVPTIPIPMAGSIAFRVGSGWDVEMYYGHIGYHIYPPARGHHYAERACRLLSPLARMYGMTELWITCNPDNIASKRTCERLGGEMVEIVPVPPDHRLFQAGDREKCRYRIKL